MFTKPRLDRFTIILYSTILLLIAVCAVLFLLNQRTGLRLRHAVIDTHAVTQFTDQTLLLSASQPLGRITASQVIISPNTAFSTTGSGETITIRFNERLSYDRDYTVTLSHIKTRQGATTLTYRFKTATPSLYYLKRSNLGDTTDNSARDDQIIHTSLKQKNESIVYSAPKIQNFVVVGEKIVIITQENDERNKLLILDRNRLKRAPVVISLPGTGTIKNLRHSPNQRLVGFTFTSTAGISTLGTYTDSLFVLDTTDVDSLRSIEGLDGQPLSVLDFQFAPDGTSIAAQGYDESVTLIDSEERYDPLPIGSARRINNFSPSGEQLIVSNFSGYSSLDMRTYRQTPLILQNPASEQIDTIDIKFFNNTPELISQQFSSNFASDRFRDNFIIETSRTIRDITSIDSKKVTTTSMETSPNDQYLILEQQNFNDSLSLSYTDNDSTLSTRSLIIDVKSGESVTMIDGINLQWQ